MRSLSLASVPGLPRSVRVLIVRRRQTFENRMFAAYAQLKRARNGGGLEPRLHYHHSEQSAGTKCTECAYTESHYLTGNGIKVQTKTTL